MLTKEGTEITSKDKVDLDIQWDEGNQKYFVTIPLKEQYKIPLNQDVKFVFSFKWENQEHMDIFPSSGFTFQNAIFTINFRKEGSVLYTILDSPSSPILLNETAVFDASRSYITYRSEAKK